MRARKSHGRLGELEGELSKALKRLARVRADYQDRRCSIDAYDRARRKVKLARGRLAAELETEQSRRTFDVAADIRAEAEELGSLDLQARTGVGLQPCSVFGAAAGRGSKCPQCGGLLRDRWCRACEVGR